MEIFIDGADAADFIRGLMSERFPIIAYNDFLSIKNENMVYL
jgi:hypothetical protein